MDTPEEVPPEAHNPYQSPDGLSGEQASSSPDDATAQRLERKYAELGQVVAAWERLRLMYNAILAVAVLVFLAFGMGRMEPTLIVTLVFGAIFANALFLACPWVDGWVTWLGLRSPVITDLLFVAVTVMGLLIAVFSVLASANPEF